MPGRQRKNVPQEPEDNGMCQEHFPGGWPHIQSEFASVACEHGQWDRPADDEGDAGVDSGTETPPES